MPTAAITGRAFGSRFANSPANRCGDRQARRFSEALCDLAQAMDRRAHPRVAQTLPQPGQRLGVPQPKGLGVLALGLNPPRAQNALSETLRSQILGNAPSTIRKRLSTLIRQSQAASSRSKVSKATKTSQPLSHSSEMACCIQCSFP